MILSAPLQSIDPNHPMDLVTKKHRWDRDKWRYLDGHESPDGNSRTERPCGNCGLVKITVHPPHGNSWREWRTKGGQVYVGDATPPCLGEVPL
jgi:hypothetical protein